MLNRVARSLYDRWLIARRKTLAQRYPQHCFGTGSYADDDFEVRAWGEGARLVVGNYCSIAAGVRILLGGNHRTDWVSTFPFAEKWAGVPRPVGHPATRGDVLIGHDVWIGADALILSGVTVGDGAVIGARAVVSRDVPAYAVAAGNPARVVRHRFDEATIARLLAVQWWHWDEARLRVHLPLLLSDRIEDFLQVVESPAEAATGP